MFSFERLKICSINVIESLILFMGEWKPGFTRLLKCRNASSRNEEHLKRAMFSQHFIQIIFYNDS